MRKSPFTPAISEFEAASRAWLSPQQLEVLHRLAHDDRVTGIWPVIERKVAGRISADALLHGILSSKSAADEIHRMPELRAKYSERSASLVAAAKRLKEYFDELPVSDKDESKVCESAKAYNAKVRESRRSFAWAAEHIAELQQLGDAAVFGRLPTSQKRDAPHVAFSVIMCDFFDERVGTRLYELVSVLTEVVFSHSGVTTEDSVRMAWKRHMQRGNDIASGNAGNRSANDLT